MIAVRIRHHLEAEPVHLCTWPATELDSLIPTLNAWGVHHLGTGDESSAGADAKLSGQFQIGTFDGYFEVVINEDEGA